MTSDEQRQRVTALREHIDALRRSTHEKGQRFRALDDDQLATRFAAAAAQQPFILGQGWTSGTVAGTTAEFDCTVSNPDGTGHNVFVSVFFGLSFFDISDAWVGRDERWPSFSSAPTLIAAQSSQNIQFTYTVPAVPRGTYIGNAVLWQGAFTFAQELYDRSIFEVSIS